MARVRDILRMFRTIFLVAGDMDLSGISFETQIGQWVVYICLCLYLCANISLPLPLPLSLWVQTCEHLLFYARQE
jgi:hypothetical protein